MSIKIDKPIWEEEINTDEDIELYQNTTFKKSIKCKNIISKNERWDINAWDINAEDINARNINAGNINAWDIDAGDINARNIDARDIDAWNINAGNIDCEKRIKKSKTAKTFSRIFIQNKSKLERKEQCQ